MATAASGSEYRHVPIQPANLTIIQAAIYWGCSESTVYRRIDAGEVKYIKGKGRNSKITIPRSELDRWSQQHLTVHPPKPKKPN